MSCAACCWSIASSLTTCRRPRSRSWCKRLFTTVTQGKGKASVCANRLFGLDYPLKCPIAQEKADEIRESYWLSELPTCENTLFAFEPIRRIVPTTITRITTSMTAYSATS